MCKSRIRNKHSFWNLLNLEVKFPDRSPTMLPAHDDEETDTQSNMDKDMFIASARENFGSKGAKEAQEVLGRVIRQASSLW